MRHFKITSLLSLMVLCAAFPVSSLAEYDDTVWLTCQISIAIPPEKMGIQVHSCISNAGNVLDQGAATGLNLLVILTIMPNIGPSQTSTQEKLNTESWKEMADRWYSGSYGSPPPDPTNSTPSGGGGSVLNYTGSSCGGGMFDPLVTYVVKVTKGESCATGGPCGDFTYTYTVASPSFSSAPVCMGY